MVAAMDTATAATQDESPLRVCLQSNDPPLSSRGGDVPSGFVLTLSQTIVEHLGRRLQVQWFVSRDDPDANLVKDADALLSDWTDASFSRNIPCWTKRLNAPCPDG